MNIDFSPTADSLVSLFKRRGIVSQSVEFALSDHGMDSYGFGNDLAIDEVPVLRILPMISSAPCWMTTKRFAWIEFGKRIEVLLSEIFEAEPRDFDRIPLAEAEVLMVEMVDGRKFDIRMPDPGILKGMWGILDRYARRNSARA